MSLAATFSPVSLSYVAALRGVKPRRPGDAFTYAQAECKTPDLLIGLAASNPEGRFFGLIGDPVAAAEAAKSARQRQVDNVMFICASPREAAARFAKEGDALPPLDFLACDESEKALAPLDREALFDLAHKALQPGGLLAYSYAAYAQDDGHLRFLVREVAPEMNVGQSNVFLDEIKKLGGFFLKSRPEVAAKLEQAIAKKVPDDFFSLFDQGEARSATFNTLVALRPRGFTYVGDSHIPANYIELSVPAEAQDIIIACQKNPLYEPLKDFALNRTVRRDIWCRHPAQGGRSVGELFGGFAYGIALAADQVPSEIAVEGKTVSLEEPLYKKLVELLSLTPAGIGDFLAQPGNEGFSSDDVVAALQVLVAVGLAKPMRGARESDRLGSLAQPRLAGTFNQYLDKTSVMGAELPFASPVMGDVIAVSARDALVMQALDRAGLANAASALLPELQRLATGAGAVTAVGENAPTAESARRMVEDSVSKSIIRWYAYGLLEAA